MSEESKERTHGVWHRLRLTSRTGEDDTSLKTRKSEQKTRTGIYTGEPRLPPRPEYGRGNRSRSLDQTERRTKKDKVEKTNGKTESFGDRDPEEDRYWKWSVLFRGKFPFLFPPGGSQTSVFNRTNGFVVY